MRENNRTEFIQGLRDGLPIGLGYFAVAFTLGIAARRAGLTAFQAGLASFLTNASAGEAAGFTVIAEGGSYLTMAIMILVANARYLLMSTALTQKLRPETGLLNRLIIGFDVTDEIFGVSIARPGWLCPFYSYGVFILPGDDGKSPAGKPGVCPERGTVRHVHCHYYSSRSEEPGCGGTGGSEHGIELRLLPATGHLGSVRRHPYYPSDGCDCRGCGADPSDQGCGA